MCVVFAARIAENYVIDRIALFSFVAIVAAQSWCVFGAAMIVNHRTMAHVQSVILLWCSAEQLPSFFEAIIC